MNLSEASFGPVISLTEFTPSSSTLALMLPDFTTTSCRAKDPKCEICSMISVQLQIGYLTAFIAGMLPRGRAPTSVPSYTQLRIVSNVSLIYGAGYALGASSPYPKRKHGHLILERLFGAEVQFHVDQSRSAGS